MNGWIGTTDRGTPDFAPEPSQQEADQLQPVSPRHLNLLRPFYDRLTQPLADLNAHMMLAWSDALRLRFTIQQGVLYVVARWNGEDVLWGPPLGEAATIRHFDFVPRILKRPEGQPPRVLYLWEECPLWKTVAQEFSSCIEHQGQEYWYLSEALATLAGPGHRKHRWEVRSFTKAEPWAVQPFVPTRDRADCENVLDSWLAAKAARIAPQFAAKLRLEAEVCRKALREGLPLSGITVRRADGLVAFSVGASHGRNCFNCMFEKYIPGVKGLPTFTFSALSKWARDRYEYVNAGEDWGVDYLMESKLRWRPTVVRRSYMLRLPLL